MINKHFFNIYIYLLLIISDVLSELVPRNETEIERVQSNVDTIYGSVKIEYVKKEKEDHFRLHLMMYLSTIAGILVLVCIIHSIVYIRPKYIQKRNEKRLKKITKKNNEINMSNVSSGSLNNYGMEELKEAKLKDESNSPEDSIDFTYNASSTDCIINLDNNNSKNRRKSNSSKKSYGKKL